MKIQRYSLCFGGKITDKKGIWVLYKDHLKAMKQNKCLNSKKIIGTCIERTIVSRIKAGEDPYEVFKDYNIKIKKKKKNVFFSGQCKHGIPYGQPCKKCKRK